jgi:parallel beta-helix repeat protein
MVKEQGYNMYRLLIPTLSFIFLIHSSLFATIINIPADYTTIQQGINASINGDTVLVQPGIYVENVDFHYRNIVLGSLFLTTGDTSYIGQTVIDGDSSGSTVTIDNYGDSLTVLTGFTITNGFAQNGGGILCYIDAGPIITNNHIRNNYASNRGGGIYCGGSSGPRISYNIFNDNFAVNGGGAMYLNSSRGTNIRNNLVYSNSSEDGGAICSRNSIFVLVNNTISFNSASAQGGGIYCWYNTMMEIRNSILWGNTASSEDQIFISSSSLGFVEYSLVEGGWQGNGNINENPQFRDSGNADFHLMATTCNDFIDSPCIDAGYPEFTDLVLNCSWGLGDSTSDMGAYGGGPSPSATENIINVPQDYALIQSAILAAGPNDTVLVQPGVYNENIRFYGRNITVGSMFIMTGDISYIDSTIIDGGSRDRVVHFIYDEDSTASLSGFTIEHGIETDGQGGGIFCDHASPVIDNNIIKNNIALYGGGIGCNSSAARIIDNVIEHNTASGDSAKGGGIYCTGSWFFSPLVKNNLITFNNSAGDFSSGGGIYCEWSDANIYDNVISYNSAGTHAASGGGAYFDECDIYIMNNIISHNYVTGTLGDGGGIEFSDSWGYFYNNVIYENYGIRFGGLHFHANDYLLQVKNSIVWGNLPYQITTGGSPTLELSYCDIQDIVWPGTGNIDVDPLFRDTTNGDFRLMSVACGDSADSPCIDSGDPDILDSLLECSWGLGGARSDMGACGGGDSVTTAVFGNFVPLPGKILLSQNYPNPFNSVTTITFALPYNAHANVAIYDILGRRVETLADKIMPAGYHRIEWNASGKTSGMYFYKIEACGMTAKKKIILLK